MRVLIVDDHEIYRDGLRTIIESRAGSFVVAEAGSARAAYPLLDSVDFDLLILDLAMPGLNGLAVLREMQRLRCRQRALVLTMHADADLAAEAFAAGARGFALKSDSRASLLDATDQVLRGERYIAPSLSLDTVESFLRVRSESPDSSSSNPLALLSGREREVFQLLMRGYRNDAIARELCISSKTVVTHREHVFRKLGVHSLGELLRLGFRHGVADASFAQAPASGADSKRSR